MITREVTWGDALVVELFKTPGGLKAVVDAIVEEVGRTIGTRNTFAKLLRVDDPYKLGDRDLYRAWLLLAALGQDPSEWGINENVVPRSIDLDTTRARLREMMLPRLDSNQQPSD
jgi:hypothetical protein